MSSVNSNTRISGTKEWSVASVNCVSGCSHNCRYCYARANAMRFGRIQSHGEWETMRVREAEVRKRRHKIDGRVMFPTTHDITPEVLDPCLAVIRNLVFSGNDVLLVSKPHRECIEAICREFGPYRDSIMFRFSIGAVDDRVLSYWEPGAPSFVERLDCLKRAHRAGFATSVSAEPLLDAARVAKLFAVIDPCVTDTVWIGKLNQIRARSTLGTDLKEIERIEAGQTDDAVRLVYKQLKDEPKVRWKESYKSVLGLALAESAGLDI